MSISINKQDYFKFPIVFIHNIIKNGVHNQHYLIIALKYIFSYNIKKYNGRYLENVLEGAADIEIELIE